MHKRLYIILMLVLLFAVQGQTQVRRNQRQKLPADLNQREELTRQAEEDVLDYLKQFDEELIMELQRMKQNKPMVYRKSMVKFYREMQHLETTKATDPEHYQSLVEEKKLDFQSARMARQYRQSKNAGEQDALRTQLQEILNRLFDNRQANRFYEIQKLEERLTKLKEQHEDRLKNKDEIVDRRFRQLIGEEAALEW